MMSNTLIEGLGVYLPEKEVSSDDILQSCKMNIKYPFQRITGIHSRRMAAANEFSIDLARKAIISCLEISRYEPKDIDLLICCNISRVDASNHQVSFEPNTSSRLSQSFGFNNAVVFDVSNACAGLFTGVYIADAFIKAGFIRRGMVVSGEYITHLTQTAQKEIQNREDPRLACLTLGDAGVALILERSLQPQVGFFNIDMYTLSQFSSLCTACPTDQAHGGYIMHTESKKLFDIAVKESSKDIAHALRKWGCKREDLHHVIMHQAGKRAIKELGNHINHSLGLELCDSRNIIINLASRGNTSTTTHFVALWDSILNNEIKSGENVLFAIQASGITIGNALYTLDDLPDRLRKPKQKRTGKAIEVPERKLPVSEKSLSRIRIESIGTLPARGEGERDSIELARLAYEQCLKKSQYEHSEIDLLINAGVYRSGFIYEPAIAALIAGKLRLNDEISPQDSVKTFAFDVFNGSVGFLNACYIVIAMIHSGKSKIAMLVTSEIENNAEIEHTEILGIKETGSAMILSQSEENMVGFGRFRFKQYPEYLDEVSSYCSNTNGTPRIVYYKTSKLESIYLTCIEQAAAVFLEEEGLNLKQIQKIVPPQISPSFIQKLSMRLNVPDEKFVSIPNEEKNLFTSSVPFSLQYACDQGLIKPRDTALIIEVGSGIQVGCALYYF